MFPYQHICVQFLHFGKEDVFHLKGDETRICSIEKKIEANSLTPNNILLTRIKPWSFLRIQTK